MKEHELSPSMELDMLLIGGMEAFEDLNKMGQTNIINIDQFPIRGHAEAVSEVIQQLNDIGVVVGEQVPGDPLFYNVTLPQGWYKKRTDHYMYSKLYDDKHRVRATIMYKSARHDRDGWTSVSQRYTSSYSSDRFIDQTLPDLVYPCILDSNGEEVWRGTQIPNISEWREGAPPEGLENVTVNGSKWFYAAADYCRKLAKDKFFEILPLYEDGINGHVKYWDEEPVFPESESQAPAGEMYCYHVQLYTYSEGRDKYVDGGNHTTSLASSDEEAISKIEAACSYVIKNYDVVKVTVYKDEKQVGDKTFRKPRVTRVSKDCNYMIDEFGSYYRDRSGWRFDE